MRTFFGDKTLLRVKAEDISAYQKARLEMGVSARTINMEVSVLRRLLKRAKTWAPLAEDVRMFPEHGAAVAKVLTAEQKAHLFQVAGSNPDWIVAHCAAALAVSTTCRGVELRNLHWRDVDLFNRAVAIRRSKTEAGHRTIPLNADGMAALARLWERAEAFGATGPDHYVFPACENGHIDPTRPQKGWRTAWRRLVREAARLAGREAGRAELDAGRGLGAAKRAWRHAASPYVGFRFHDLRHQAVTELAEAGASDATLMAVAGHLSRQMMEHYSHVRMAAKREALAKLESGLMGCPDARAAECTSGAVN